MAKEKDQPVKTGQVFESVYRDKYTVKEVYGGAGTPLPLVVHLELSGRGMAMNSRRPQEFLTLTEGQLNAHFKEVRQ